MSPRKYARQINRLTKTLLVALTYLTAYVLLQFFFVPDVPVTFVSEDFSLGERYALILLIASNEKFTEVESAQVFKRRQCGDCFLTGNKALVPFREFDAIVYASRVMNLSTDSGQFALQTEDDCLTRKLVGCDVRVVSGGEGYTLCEFCDLLLNRRKWMREHL